MWIDSGLTLGLVWGIAVLIGSEIAVHVGPSGLLVDRIVLAYGDFMGFLWGFV